MKGRIILCKGASKYGVARHFADDLAIGFGALGRDVLVVDVAPENYNLQVIQDAFTRECDFICGFNLQGGDLGLGNEGVKFLKDVGIPYIGILVDHPLYHLAKFQLINTVGIPDNFLITCVDKFHLDVLKCCSPVKFSTFLPHAGSVGEGNQYKNMNRRNQDLVFCGSYCKPAVSWANYRIKPLLDDVAEYMLSTENIQVQDALQQVLKAKNYVLSADFFQRVLNISFRVDLYVRNVRRARLITELADAGIKLNIYGEGWEQFPCTKYFNIHKAVSYDEVLKVMADAKIILNLVSSFSYGSHERVFSAMLNGAVALTDANGYWKDHFVEGKEIVTYSILKQNQLPQIITTLLADLPQLDMIAQAGQRKAEQDHTWKSRAQEIIGYVEMMEGVRALS